MNLRITNHKMWPHFYVYTFTISKHYYLMIVTIKASWLVGELKTVLLAF